MGFIAVLILSMFGAGNPAYADCALIDRIDRLFTIQSRLARDPDTTFFATDIRQLRRISAGISSRAVLTAVDGNSFTGRGAEFLRFLQDTQALLRRASLDDPQSVRAHFDSKTQATLKNIEGYLTDIRCTAEQIAIASATPAERNPGNNSDAEDLAEVAESLTSLAKVAIQPQNLGILAMAVIVIARGLPLFLSWRHLLRRRAKRHNCQYLTHYIWANHRHSGVLVDISCHGTKLRHDADTPPPIGTSVGISIGETVVDGTVIWSNMHYSGVNFRRSISLATVKMARLAIHQTQKQNGAPRDAA